MVIPLKNCVLVRPNRTCVHEYGSANVCDYEGIRETASVIFTNFVGTYYAGPHVSVCVLIGPRIRI